MFWVRVSNLIPVECLVRIGSPQAFNQDQMSDHEGETVTFSRLKLYLDRSDKGARSPRIDKGNAIACGGVITVIQ